MHSMISLLCIDNWCLVLSIGEPDRLPVYEDRLVIGGSDFVGWVLYLYAAGVCRKGGLVFTIKGGQLSFAGQDPESPT